MNPSLSQRLEQLGLGLPSPMSPLGTYRTVTTYGKLLHVSGLGPIENGAPIAGIVGDDISLEEAQRAAQLTMLMILASIDESHSLENIERCLRLTVYVRGNASFAEHYKVANGASDVLLHLFGRPNLPARSALGVYTLPMGLPVEIDSIFVLRD
jgi:enamine deaminase RidA (YjgF/YER057c/UK114 family)